MNFILGGLGSGTIVVAYLMSLWPGLDGVTLRIIFTISGAIMAVGLFFVWLKIGRKLRAPFVILRPNTSWMSREVYAAGVFYLALAGAWVLPNDAWAHVCGFAAAGFLYAQARILHAGKGIPAWRADRMIWMLIISGLAEGAGLLAILSVGLPQLLSTVYVLPILGIVLIVFSGSSWRAYVESAADNGIGPKSREVLEAATLWLYIGGHLLPIIGYMGILAWPGVPFPVIALAGLLAIAGGAFWKSVVITRAGHMQGFALANYPQRGSGRYAAPLSVG
ncbi:MAG: dimethyl sulfoxide reductase anchor subunit [Rhodospirillales bacterium]|nr:dimethyl sulfoxide reductase anchor subunit [Rhodospirillales bacterium]